MMTLHSIDDLSSLSSQELDELSRRIQTTLKQRKRVETMVEVTEVNLFGSKTRFKSPDKALESLVDYVKDDDYELFKGVGHVEGHLPFVGLKSVLITKEEYDQNSDDWMI